MAIEKHIPFAPSKESRNLMTCIMRENISFDKGLTAFVSHQKAIMIKEKWNNEIRSIITYITEMK